MDSHKEGPETIYLTLLLLGVLGNIFLLYLHSPKVYHWSEKKILIRMIIINLALAHILMIIFRGIPVIISVWGWKSFLADLVGKILTYFITVTRGVSLCSTCLLSVFQAITISPNCPMWVEVKIRAPKCIGACSLFCWIFNILIHIIVATNINDVRNSSKEGWKLGHNSFDFHTSNTIKILIWKSFFDALFLSLMICTSAYMVFFLYRHNKRIQHIHSISLSHKASPEIRATKAILMLVVTFVSFNTASSPFIIYIVSTEAMRHWGIRFTVALSLFYPIVSPFMLMQIDTQRPKSSCVLLNLKRC
ncbi:vomeronasal type-1 receptor 1-like [Gracilinanus agilis]|uniref:vomeronasal type-1 receptor 1-like n=1 Tax=Gracilinanus agilis TaxID=191870 RepID=UPI001CFCEFE3|nr:vomeronasal type-1 receptor 1-like [Gracilinanus agilis]